MKKNDKKKSLMTYLPKIVLAVISVLFVVAAISMVVYLIAGRNSQELRKLESTEETTSWSVYENKKYGFEIKYPSDIFSPNISSVENTDKEKVQQRIDFQIDDKSKISILIWNKSIAKETNEEYERVVVNEKVILQNKGNPLKNYIYHKSYILQVEYFGDQKEENTKLYNNMLATLKLVD